MAEDLQDRTRYLNIRNTLRALLDAAALGDLWQRWHERIAASAEAFVDMVHSEVAKFTEGAWIICLLLPALVYGFHLVHRHYASVRASLSLAGAMPVVIAALPRAVGLRMT